MNFRIFTALTFSLVTVISAIAQQTVDISELVKEDRMHYLDGKPFTGTVNSRSNNVDEPIRYTVVDGLANGVKTAYYDEERTHVKWQVPIKNGHSDGLYVHFYGNGNISFTVPRLKDKLQGTRHCYREDGTLWHVHHYRNDVEHGIKELYHPTGELWQTTPYRNGKQHGHTTVWYETGEVRRTGTYKKGEQHGIWTIYAKDGKVLQREKYRRGEKVE